MPSAFRLLGVRVDNVDEDEALAIVADLADAGTPRQVVTLNPEFLVQAWEHEAFRRVLNGAHLAVADGVGVTLAARWLGHRPAGRVSGVDLVRRAAALGAARGFRLFLLGGGPGIAEQAAEVLRRENPGLAIAGTHGGSPRVEEEEEIAERVRGGKPHFLFVAFGAPDQDLWIARNLKRLDVPVCVGIGGAFDYISGAVPRAPAWMRRWGLEWLFRLMRQPWRWRRMMRLPRFVWLVLRHGSEGPSRERGPA